MWQTFATGFVLLASVNAAEVDLTQTGEAIADYGIAQSGVDYVTDAGNGIQLKQLKIVPLGDEIIMSFRISNNGSGIFDHTEVNELFGDVFDQIEELTGIPLVEWPATGNNYSLSINFEGVNANGRYYSGSEMANDGDILFYSHFLGKFRSITASF